MGPVGAFQDGYQQGYLDGFGSGFLSERPGWRARVTATAAITMVGTVLWIRPAQRVAYDTGYQDGASMAREDIYQEQALNPNARAFGGRDDGYSRAYGDKKSIKAAYTDGYAPATSNLQSEY